jgi:hypothetical protein
VCKHVSKALQYIMSIHYEQTARHHESLIGAWKDWRGNMEMRYLHKSVKSNEERMANLLAMECHF